MPYVEGFGTWPFGEEWLWEAVACVYLPLLDVLDGAPVTLGLTPVLCDQLEAMRADAGDRYLRFLRDIRAPIHAEDAAGLDDTGEPMLAAEIRRAAADYTRADEGLRGAGPRPARRLRCARARRALDLRRHPWAPAADGHGRRGAAPGGHRHRGAPAPLRRVGRRLLAAGVRLRPRAGARAGRPRRARILRRPDAGGRVRPPHPGGHGRGAGCRPDRLGVGRARLVRPARLPGARQLPQLLGPHRPRPKPWNNAGEPYDHDAALELAHGHARDFVARAAEKLADGGLLCFALDTELLGHWWYEGLDWLRAVFGEAEARAAAGHRVRGRGAAEPAARPLAPSDLGQREGLRDLGRPRRGGARLRGARRGAAHRGGRGPARPPRTPRSSGRRASCSPCSRATGRSWSPATWRRTTPRSGCASTRGPWTLRLPL